MCVRACVRACECECECVSGVCTKGRDRETDRQTEIQRRRGRTGQSHPLDEKRNTFSKMTKKKKKKIPNMPVVYKRNTVFTEQFSGSSQ